MTAHEIGIPVLIVLAFHVSHAPETHVTYPRANLLVEAHELADPEARGRYRLLDTRTKEKYRAMHIPGAAWTDAGAWSKAFNSDTDAAAWARRIGDLGIDLDTPVVVYGESDTPEAARTWWILRYWGIKDVRLLNGGWQAWQNDRGDISMDQTEIPKSHPRLQPQKDRLTTMDELLQALDSNKLQIIDARSKAEFCGEQKLAKRNGAIPGALHLEWKELIDPTTQRFKSPEELSKLFSEKKIDLKRPTVTHCQSGGRAAVMAFALELMGAKDVSNYYKSWSEWGNAEDTPIEKPKK